MKKTFVWGACLCASLLGSTVQALDIPVTGTGAIGREGETVHVVLDYDYGASFAAIVEDLQFEWQFAGITFMPAESTIGATLLRGDPALQPLPQNLNAAQQFALAHSGGFLVNPAMPGSEAGYTGWSMSFYTADGVAHLRSGHVYLALAFKILPTAPPGVFKVRFTNGNVLVDLQEAEYSFPSAARSLFVTVVPELGIAWMLLPGLALVGLSARRRLGHRR